MPTLLPVDKKSNDDRTDLQIAEEELDVYRSAITRYITVEEALPFFTAMEGFLASLPKDKSHQNYAEKYVRAYQIGASTIRAPYCFFRLSDGDSLLPTPRMPHGALYRCLSVMDGVSEEVTACKDCPHYEERQTYQKLLDRFVAAKRNQIEVYENWMQNLKK